VQAALASRSKPKTRKFSLLYTGRVRCGDCQGLYSGDIKKERFVYYVHRAQRDCKNTLRERDLEDVTLSILDSLRIDEAT
jgi:hypothetical protein